MRNLELNVVPSVKPDWFEQVLEEDKQMVLLENPNSKMLPQRDIDDNLHGRPISYCVAKVCIVGFSKRHHRLFSRFS